VNMGGMSVLVPRDVILEDAPAESGDLQRQPSEGSQPVLRLRTEQKRGEIDVIRR